MNQKSKKPFLIYLSLVLILLAIFFLFRIDLFPGEITTKDKIYTCDISLSYFINMGGSKQDFANIESFRLLPKGYALALIMILGLPALVAYRVHLNAKKKRKILRK